MRKIAPELWRDDFIIGLNHMERLLWVGLIVTLADDQGRLLNNPRIIRLDIFPDEKITARQIEKSLEKFSQAKRICIYKAGDKSLIQIINWWKYQSSASWMGKSQYPPPERWHDLFRFHGSGRKIETSPNWDSKVAGFLPSDYLEPTYPLPSHDSDVNGNDDSEVNDDSEKEEGVKKETKTVKLASAASSISTLEIYKKVTELDAFPSGHEKAIITLERIISHFDNVEDCIAYLKQVIIWWCNQPRKNGSGNYSLLNPGWIDRALVGLTGERPWENKPKKDSKKKNAQEIVDELRAQR